MMNELSEQSERSVPRSSLSLSSSFLRPSLGRGPAARRWGRHEGQAFNHSIHSLSEAPGGRRSPRGQRSELNYEVNVRRE